MEPETLAVRSLRAVAYGLGQLATAIRWLLGAVRAVAFWGTILLPFLVVGALVSGLARSDPSLFGLLFGLNVCCLVVSQRVGSDN